MVTSFEYTYRLYAVNAIHQSASYGELILKIGLEASKPGKPVLADASFAGQTMDITWVRPEDEGGWPIQSFNLWVDDGAGQWPNAPISVDASTLDLDNPTY